MKSPRAFWTLAVSLVAAFAIASAPAAAATTQLQRVFIIMMENQGFDDVIGHQNANGMVDAPYLTSLAQMYGLSTYYFGVTHPSLPNYLAMVAGDTFGIHDDNPSCYAIPAQSPCDVAKGQSIVNTLTAAHMSWEAYEQSMPRAGYLGPQYPATPGGPVLYAQKHNPFVYFKSIASNVALLSHIVPLDSHLSQLRNALANPSIAPQYNFIVPDQCHDMHGTSTCSDPDQLIQAGDMYVRSLVNVITHSPAYTANSAIIITWDENDYSSSIGCCESGKIGGGHVATIVLTPRYTMPIESALPSNHYTTLRTIENAFNLPLLGRSALVQPTLFNLLP